MSQFILYAVFTAGAVGTIAEVWGDLQRAAGATERLLQLLATRSPIAEPDTPVALPAHAEGIRFDNVTFHYPSRPGAAALSQLHARSCARGARCAGGAFRCGQDDAVSASAALL